MPFGKLVVMSCPDEVDISLNMTAEEALAYLKEHGQDAFLNTPVGQFILHDENRKTRKLVHASFVISLVGSVLALLAITYTAIIHQTIPSWYDFCLPLIIPAFVMWNRVGIFKAENANNVANVISALAPGALKKVFSGSTTTTSSTTTTTNSSSTPPTSSPTPTPPPAKDPTDNYKNPYS